MKGGGADKDETGRQSALGRPTAAKSKATPPPTTPSTKKELPPDTEPELTPEQPKGSTAGSEPALTMRGARTAEEQEAYKASLTERKRQIAN